MTLLPYEEWNAERARIAAGRPDRSWLRMVAVGFALAVGAGALWVWA